jgi:hypothetical protein
MQMGMETDEILYVLFVHQPAPESTGKRTG